MNTISAAALRWHTECDLSARIAALEGHLGCAVPPEKHVPFAVWAEVTPDTRDLFRLLRVLPDGRKIAIEVAIRAATRAADVAARCPGPAIADHARASADQAARYAAADAAREAAYAAHVAHVRARAGLSPAEHALGVKAGRASEAAQRASYAERYAALDAVAHAVSAAKLAGEAEATAWAAARADILELTA